MYVFLCFIWIFWMYTRTVLWKSTHTHIFMCMSARGHIPRDLVGCSLYSFSLFPRSCSDRSQNDPQGNLAITMFEHMHIWWNLRPMILFIFLIFFILILYIFSLLVRVACSKNLFFSCWTVHRDSFYIDKENCISLFTRSARCKYCDDIMTDHQPGVQTLISPFIFG